MGNWCSDGSYFPWLRDHLKKLKVSNNTQILLMNSLKLYSFVQTTVDKVCQKLRMKSFHVASTKVFQIDFV